MRQTGSRRKLNTWQLVCLAFMLLVLTTVQASENFYELLKVDPDADTAKIKKAFRRASLEYHPDKNPGKSMQSILPAQESVNEVELTSST